MNRKTTNLAFASLPIILRVAVFWAGYVAIIYAVGVLKSPIPPQWAGLVWGAASSILLLTLTLTVLRIEGRRPADVGVNLTRGSIPCFAVGALIGFAIYGVILVLISVLLGKIAFTGSTGVTAIAAFSTVISTLALACMEELGFRGYPLRTLTPAVGYWPAQIIVATAFGLCHLLFGYSWWAILTGVIPCGLLFGAAAIASRGLALPIGLHAGLNLAQWSVGEKGLGGGFWAISVEENVRTRIATMTPAIVVGVMLTGTMAFWIWSRWRWTSQAIEVK